MANWEQQYLVERQAHQETAQKDAAIILGLTRKVASLHLWLALTTAGLLGIGFVAYYGSR